MAHARRDEEEYYSATEYRQRQYDDDGPEKPKQNGRRPLLSVRR